jgi:hypothetical protein
MCKTPSKYAARMGQCFSTTIDISTVGSSQESFASRAASALGFAKSRPRVNDSLPDILSRTGQEHSDGVGLISRAYLDAILLQIPFGPMNKDDVSAIQIRFGGAKGGATHDVFLCLSLIVLIFVLFSSCCVGFQLAKESRYKRLRHLPSSQPSEIQGPI